MHNYVDSKPYFLSFALIGSPLISCYKSVTVMSSPCLHMHRPNHFVYSYKVEIFSGQNTHSYKKIDPGDTLLKLLKTTVPGLNVKIFVLLQNCGL